MLVMLKHYLYCMEPIISKFLEFLQSMENNRKHIYQVRAYQAGVNALKITTNLEMPYHIPII